MFRPKTKNPKIGAGKEKYKAPNFNAVKGEVIATSNNGKTRYYLNGNEVIRFTNRYPSFVGTKEAFDEKVKSGAIVLDKSILGMKSYHWTCPTCNRLWLIHENQLEYFPAPCVYCSHRIKKPHQITVEEIRACPSEDAPVYADDDE